MVLLKYYFLILLSPFSRYSEHKEKRPDNIVHNQFNLAMVKETKVPTIYLLSLIEETNRSFAFLDSNVTVNTISRLLRADEITKSFDYMGSVYA